MRCPHCGYEGSFSEFVREEKRTLKFKAFGLIPVPMSYYITYLVCPKCGRLLRVHCYKPSNKIYRFLRLPKVG